MESETVQRRSCAPHRSATPHCQTPQRCYRGRTLAPNWTTALLQTWWEGAPLAYLSLHFFLPVVHFHPVVALQPPGPSSVAQLSLKNSTLFPVVVSGHSCVSRVIRSHQCSKPGIRASTFSGHLTRLFHFFFFFFFLKWTLMCTLSFFVSFQLMPVFVLIHGDMS